MANSNLNCSASSCTYNNCGGCYASSINVDGCQATTTSNTCCSSYQDKASSGFSNCSGECNCVSTANVNCKATNCKHNEGECCKADKVHINCDNASCETFCCK
ncbi:MAG: DUF1540 domain-containing protein [Romboutsia sp.]